MWTSHPFLAADRAWTSAGVQALWDKGVGPRVEYFFMHVALSQLTRQKYGSIRRRTGAPRRYRYESSDPHIRPLLRITRAAHDD